jgi:hypothetical protein
MYQTFQNSIWRFHTGYYNYEVREWRIEMDEELYRYTGFKVSTQFSWENNSNQQATFLAETWRFLNEILLDDYQCQKHE